MSENKITLTLKHESNTKVQKTKNLDFSVKIVIKSIPKNVEELEALFLEKDASGILEMALKDISIHNENINDYAKMYRGDPESELNKKHVIRTLDFALDAGPNSVSGKIDLIDGSFKAKSTVREVLNSLVKKLSSSAGIQIEQ